MTHERTMTKPCKGCGGRGMVLDWQIIMIWLVLPFIALALQLFDMRKPCPHCSGTGKEDAADE